MKKIMVDQYVENGLLNVYVLYDNSIDLLEDEQALLLSKAYECIERFKVKYDINVVEFYSHNATKNTIDKYQVVL